MTKWIFIGMAIGEIIGAVVSIVAVFVAERKFRRNREREIVNLARIVTHFNLVEITDYKAHHSIMRIDNETLTPKWDIEDPIMKRYTELELQFVPYFLDLKKAIETYDAEN